VTLHIAASKVVVDETGVETPVPMHDWVQIGVFASTGKRAEFGETLYLQIHHIRSGAQTITVTVPLTPKNHPWALPTSYIPIPGLPEQAMVD
jgi:ABC-2 type transport system permease protein